MGDELPAGLWVRPDQEIEARQPVAPLNRTITAFGELAPEEDRIDATDVTIGGELVAAPEVAGRLVRPGALRPAR